MPGRFIRIPVADDRTLVLRLRPDRRTIEFGAPDPSLLRLGPRDDWRAEWTQNSETGERAWRLRFWVGAQTRGRLSPKKWPDPGTLISYRIYRNHVAPVAVNINSAVWCAWPHTAPAGFGVSPRAQA